MVVSVIEITRIALLVMVRRALSLMRCIIRHDAMVRKCGAGGGGREAALEPVMDFERRQ